MKKLYRSRTEKIVAGVCGGLADYFEVDPVLIRLLLVLSVILGAGAGLLAYIIAWIIIPEQPSENGNIPVAAEEGTADSSPAPATVENRGEVGTQRAYLAGIILIGLGGLFILREFFPYFSWEKLWPVTLIAVGFWLIYRGIRGRGR